MSDLVAQFKAWLPGKTTKDRADALKVIDEQIDMVRANLQDLPQPQDLLSDLDSETAENAEAWQRSIETRRLDLVELRQVKAILTARN